ncbi:hypothetical protein BU23DRAFT_139419 [Bimuria novae-zelandiae CBS 107.79]|uniref:Uncharacterized protein n=1 Tax=Bimuria novae-zelandiae CBS 107.79 TaxID=1447943 RepID=A0A6A5V929_9PLEO|nr:hypothetical protein BU23DRAFT_139419 [Bimuria novae-zelandiae CBS 107.79]
MGIIGAFLIPMAEEYSRYICSEASSSSDAPTPASTPARLEVFSFHGMCTPGTSPATSQASPWHGTPRLSLIQANSPATNLFGRPYPHSGFYPIPVDSSSNKSASCKPPRLYALMFATGNQRFEIPIKPRGNPSLICESAARALYELQLKVGWLPQVHSQAGANVSVEVSYPEVMANEQHAHGVLILKRGVTRGREWINWYLWWLEDIALVG